MKKLFLILFVLVIAVVLVPPLISMTGETDRRTYTTPEPDESRYREVTFSNEAAHLELAGMLFLPEGDGPFPAVVIIHGSGDSRRENRWYLTLTHYLQDQGIAVLLPDKRGSVKSAGDWRSSSMEDLAGDTAAALQFLDKEYADRISTVGVIGLSQGGWIAPIVASGDNATEFVVNMVGSTLPAHDVLVYEETFNLRQAGFLPGVADVIARLSTYILRKVTQKEFWTAVGNFDPLPYWKNVEVPALALFGGDDTNVPSYQSAEALRTLNHPNIKVMIFEGSGHALQDPPGNGDDYIRNEALEAISRFIFSVTP